MDADMPPLAKAGLYSCECQNPLPRRPIFEKFKALTKGGVMQRSHIEVIAMLDIDFTLKKGCCFKGVVA